MSLATELLAETTAAKARQQEAEDDDRQKAELLRTVQQEDIFNRARTLFDGCIKEARAAGARTATEAVVQLWGGRFDCRDFDPYRNLWEMTVLALRENGLTAELYFAQSTENDELGGRGECTVHTPQIRLSWGPTP